MNILNIVDNLSQVNFGIWNAAISTAKQLKTEYNSQSFLIFPEIEHPPQLPDIIKIPVPHISINKIQFNKKNKTILYIKDLLLKHNISQEDSIVVTHGCWQFPTRWGSILKEIGFKWIYVPHGMLEPWSIKQKKIRKCIYWNIFEYPLSKKANHIRAVGSPEYKNLLKFYKKDKLKLIPNGTEIKKSRNHPPENNNSPILYLFMARIHYKKGIVPLIKAWKKSVLNNSQKYKLTIAGPDDGILDKVKQEISIGTTNIFYVGSQYGKQKEELLEDSSFYVLPSFSEGFPTSILEAMQWHIIPIISHGCNFPEIFKEGLALNSEPNEKSIIEALNNSTQFSKEQINDLGNKCNSFVTKHYSLNNIAKLQFELFNNLL